MTDLLRISLNGDGALSIAANLWLFVAVFVVLAALAFLLPWVRQLLFREEYEINEVEIGIGSGKVKLKPNNDDIQIAYKLWVELKTRKLGLPFDEKHDIILEIYNSWYEFFRLTRELIKAIPASKIRDQKSTQLLVRISIDVLNESIRPHLTKWQGRFRRWYEKAQQDSTLTDASPQDLQKKYPEYQELVKELKNTNAHLVAYAGMLAQLVELNPELWKA